MNRFPDITNLKRFFILQEKTSWTEEYGVCLWWKEPFDRPYVTSPKEGKTWSEGFTHWTPIPFVSLTDPREDLEQARRKYLSNDLIVDIKEFEKNPQHFLERMKDQPLKIYRGETKVMSMGLGPNDIESWD